MSKVDKNLERIARRACREIAVSGGVPKKILIGGIRHGKVFAMLEMVRRVAEKGQPSDRAVMIGVDLGKGKDKSVGMVMDLETGETRSSDGNSG